MDLFGQMKNFSHTPRIIYPFVLVPNSPLTTHLSINATYGLVP